MKNYFQSFTYCIIILANLGCFGMQTLPKDLLIELVTVNDTETATIVLRKLSSINPHYKKLYDSNTLNIIEAIAKKNNIEPTLVALFINNLQAQHYFNEKNTKLEQEKRNILFEQAMTYFNGSTCSKIIINKIINQEIIKHYNGLPREPIEYKDGYLGLLKNNKSLAFLKTKEKFELDIDPTFHTADDEWIDPQYTNVALIQPIRDTLYLITPSFYNLSLIQYDHTQPTNTKNRYNFNSYSSHYNSSNLYFNEADFEWTNIKPLKLFIKTGTNNLHLVLKFERKYSILDDNGIHIHNTQDGFYIDELDDTLKMVKRSIFRDNQEEIKNK